MKLLNFATAWFAALLLLVLLVWAGLFYYNMLDEIYDSMDDGLENQKMLVLRQAALDPQVLQQKEFANGYYKVKELAWQQARKRPEVYLDTLMYMQNEKDFEPVRMLKTVFRHQNRYYELRVITSMVEEDDLISDLMYSLLWLYLGLLASILVLNNVLLRRIWRPCKAASASSASYTTPSTRCCKARSGFSSARKTSLKMPPTNCKHPWPSASTSSNCWPTAQTCRKTRRRNWLP